MAMYLCLIPFTFYFVIIPDCFSLSVCVWWRTSFIQLKTYCRTNTHVRTFIIWIVFLLPFNIMLENILNWYNLKKKIWSTNVFIQVNIEMDLLCYWNLLIWERATPNKNNTFFSIVFILSCTAQMRHFFSLSNIGFASLDCLF